MAATKAISCPQFPFISQQGDTDPTLQSLLGFSQSELEDGFMRLCTTGFTANLAEVYQAMKAYISIVEKYQAGSTAEPDMERISSQRNLVQYRLLSLTPAKCLDYNFRQSYPIYEACRLAGLIFGVGVVFPLPSQTVPFQILVTCLQAELRESNCESTFCSGDANGVLLWVLTLGGIAATGLPERTWFAATLGRVAARSGLSEWQDLERFLVLMPWLDSACGYAGRQLWGELDNAVARVRRTGG